MEQDDLDSIQLKKNQDAILKRLLHEPCDLHRAELAKQAYELQKLRQTHASRLSEKEIEKKLADDNRRIKKNSKRSARRDGLRVERELVKSREEAIQASNEMSGLSGMRCREILVPTPGSGKRR
ncbi:MAG: hypothetical protein C0519_01405 [Hyphomicrobium sp.]|nr:hypothetical protein [Hyphomicrobium sp.]PPD09548.1 MAG: hypothetical protein CTY28_01700 [Hyphomicrobium sp.]